MAAVARQIIPVFLWVHLHGALLVGTCTEECTGTLMAGHALRNVLIILVLDNTIDIGYIVILKYQTEVQKSCQIFMTTIQCNKDVHLYSVSTRNIIGMSEVLVTRLLYHDTCT